MLTLANLSQAAGDLVKELQRIQENITLCYQATLYDVGGLLVYYTPIDTGLASSNWNVGQTGGVFSEREPEMGVKGAAALRVLSEQVKNMVVGQDAVFKNPVDYIDDLERGTSRQAIGGMVTPTASRVESLWDANAMKFKL